MTDTPDSIDRAIEALSTSCLNRARRGDHDAWIRLERTHRGLICWWCVQARIPGQDIDDVVQEVFASLATGNAKLVPSSFRGLLWKICRVRIKDYWRSRDKLPIVGDGSQIDEWLDAVEAESSSRVSGGFDRATRIVFDAIVQEARGNFSEVDWQAFWKTMVDERSPAEVAVELGVSRNQVYLARSRILRHIRLTFNELTYQAEP